MNKEIIDQLYSLIIYLFSGIGIGILFDIFRIFRRSFKTADIVTYIEDFFFWIITGIFLIFIVFVFSNGQLRLYNFLGMIIGITCYILLFSKKFININVFIITYMKKIIYKIFIIPLKKLFMNIVKIMKPITFFVINIKKQTKKPKKYKNKRRILKVNVEKYK